MYLYLVDLRVGLMLQRKLCVQRPCGKKKEGPLKNQISNETGVQRNREKSEKGSWRNKNRLEFVGLGQDFGLHHESNEELLNSLK